MTASKLATKLGSKLGRTIAIALLVLGLIGGGVAYGGWYHLFREVPTVYEAPADHFKYGSIGTENSEGLPYWIWMILPRAFPEYLPGSGGYTSLGITWEEGEELPVGFTKKTIGFPRQGISCAICHHATYRTTPTSNPTIVPGGPSTKFDLQSYLRFLGNCASDPRFTPDYLLDKLKYVVDLSWFDRLLYRFVIIPRTHEEMLKNKASFAWMDSRPPWGPGRIDPFNPVKFRQLAQPLDDTIGNSDMVPLWNLKQHQGFVWHWDGLETSLTETVREGAIGDGATKKSLPLASLQRVEDFITETDPPKYPFVIDTAAAEKGSKVFDNSCATCHAIGGKRTGTVIPVAEVGTDRHRIDMWTQAAADSYMQYADGYSWDFKGLQKNDGYVSVLLDGLWLRAPYLHNGSVPSLTALLEKPENRPKVFYRGYDVYDSKTVGFVSEGKEAAKDGFRYDVQVPGNSNQGHLYGTELPAEDKKNLIEYLKTL